MVKDWICNCRELRFQFHPRKNFLLELSKDGGGRPSPWRRVMVPHPWMCGSRDQAGDSSPSVPCPHAAVWGARAFVWGGQGLWKGMLACQAPVVQERLWERRVPSVPRPAAPLGVMTPLPITRGSAHSRCSLCAMVGTGADCAFRPSRWSGGTSWAPSCRAKAAMWSL